LLAGFGRGGGIRFEGFEFALEDAPVILRVGPGADDFVFDFDGGIETEVGGLLAGEVLDTAEDVGRENRAFDANAGVSHAATSGRRM
jgi:hypothetical protein